MAKLGTSSRVRVASRCVRRFHPARILSASALNRVLHLGLLTLVLSGVSFAAAPIPDCDPGKLSDYLKMSAEGCAVGKYRLSNFSYHPGSDGLAADAISITVGVSPGSDDPGILIEGHWSHPLRQPSIISYSVEPLPAGRLLAAATLQMQFGQVTDTGEARVATDICPASTAGNHCPVADLKLHVVLSATAQRKASDNGRLPGPASQLRITNVVTLSSGRNGAASFNGFMLVLHAAQ